MGMKTDRVNWIIFTGTPDREADQKLQAHFRLHPLLLEDIFIDQRPKFVVYEEHLFVTLKIPVNIDQSRMEFEQVSFILGKNYLLTFLKKDSSPIDEAREQLRINTGSIRKKQTDYLLYRLMDIMIDSYYSVLDQVGEQTGNIEDKLPSDRTGHTFRKIQRLNKDMIYLHKALYPLRETIEGIIRNENGIIRKDTLPYFSNLENHVNHLIDSLDTHRDLVSGIFAIYLNMQNNRLNEIIRVLTIISTIFIPLSFIAGVYGMNFDYFPELRWRYGYYATWGVMVVIATTMVFYFRYKKWL